MYVNEVLNYKLYPCLFNKTKTLESNEVFACYAVCGNFHL